MTDLSIAVVGEALMDVVETGDDEPRLARPGGSPYNVAIGLARLGHRAAFVGRISTDPLGVILRRHAALSGVDLTLTVEARRPSTVALVSLDEDGAAEYRFGVHATADFCFTAAELARIPADIPAVHFGSLASWLPPGDRRIADRIGRLRDSGCAVTYDPNVRPQLQPDPAAAGAQVEAALPLADLVKTSEEDLAWIRPGATAADVAADWLQRGPSVIVVTHGGDGASAFTRATTERCAPVPVEVVDTVGAGDAFMSGLLDSLLRRDLLTRAGLAGIDGATVRAALDDAALVAAITCSRAGAHPPRRAELLNWQAGTPRYVLDTST